MLPAAPPDCTAWPQMLVRAHVAANTDVNTLPGGPLSGKELQEGLMAGYGSRARRKHVQRHARKLSALGSMQQALSVTREDQDSNHVSESSEEDSHTPNNATSDVDHSSVAAGTTERVGTGHSLIGSIHHHGHDKQQESTADAALLSNSQHDSTGGAADAAQTPERPAAYDKQPQSGAPKTSVTDLGRGGHFWHGERYSSLLGQRQSVECLPLLCMYIATSVYISTRVLIGAEGLCHVMHLSGRPCAFLSVGWSKQP